MDDLSFAQFDLFVRVLSCPASERDFKSLMTLENIQEVIDHTKEFVPLDIPRINFIGSAKTQARERAQSSLIE